MGRGGKSGSRTGSSNRAGGKSGSSSGSSSRGCSSGGYGGRDSTGHRPSYTLPNNSKIGGCLNCFTIMLIAPMVLALISFVVLIPTVVWLMFSDSITKSTVTRNILSDELCVESNDWYEDNLNWIDRDEVLITGMKEFYKKTEVQPYLIISNNINNKSVDFTKYNYLFSDNGHILLLFVEYADSEYSKYIFVGEQAYTVIDDEAKNIIFDYLDYYYTSSLEDNEYFSAVFEKSLERIMRKTANNKEILLIGLIVGIAVVILLVISKKNRKCKNYTC